MTQLSGKVALVTGASAGLGAAVAQLFARARRDGIRHRPRRRPDGRRCSTRCPAVGTRRWTSRPPTRAATPSRRCVDAFGRLDVLANVAGFHQMRHTTTMTDEDWDRDLAVNLNGPFYLCRAALPHLLETAGNIVNVTSIAGVEGEVYSAGYCAAKHGLVGLTRALAIEYTKEKIRVNAICPGGMPTPQATEFTAPDNADWDLILRIASPRGFMEPVDVAKSIAFLASDDAAAIHGAVYRVDNGKGAG